MAAPLRNPFALAIDEFLYDIKRTEDLSSPFHREVLCQLSKVAIHDDSTRQNEQAAQALLAFIQDMDNKRRDSKTFRCGEKLRPLVSGLSQFTSVTDIAIQAGPGAVVVLYSGARLVLLVSVRFSCTWSLFS